MKIVYGNEEKEKGKYQQQNETNKPFHYKMKQPTISMSFSTDKNDDNY